MMKNIIELNAPISLPGWDPIVIKINYGELHDQLMRKTSTDIFFSTYASRRDQELLIREPILLGDQQEMLEALRDDVVDALCGYLQAWTIGLEEDDEGIEIELCLSAPTRIVKRLNRRALLYLLHAMAADVASVPYPTLAQKASDRAARAISAIRSTLLKFEVIR